MILKDKKSVRDYLNAVIKETLGGSGLVEDEEQSTDSVQQKEPLPSSKGESDDSSKLETADIAVDDVIDKLNTIRSGRSFKDSSIKGALERYIGDLETAERTALYAFLKGIVQIVTGEIPGDSALEPADKPANVEMEKEPSVKKRTVKPNVIRTGAPQAKETPDVTDEKPAKTGGEDTSPPLPVTPKKRTR